MQQTAQQHDAAALAVRETDCIPPVLMSLTAIVQFQLHFQLKAQDAVMKAVMENAV